jgi:hypothetical protein
LAITTSVMPAKAGIQKYHGYKSTGSRPSPG